MKRLLSILLLFSKGYAMEDNLRKPERSISTAGDIFINIDDLLHQVDTQLTTNDAEFKQLLVEYFKKESVTIESNIMPHLDRRLRDSDENIKDILLKDDQVQLKEFIHTLVTESVEDAFKDKDHRFNELKEMSEVKLKRAKFALITAIASGVLGIASVFVGVYFGR